MSSPSEPVETVSMSIDLSFLPSFMIEPLPKARSIWVSAASRAFDFSMGFELSTTRRAAGLMSALIMAYNSEARQPRLRGDQAEGHCTRFLLGRNIFFLGGRHIYPLGTCTRIRLYVPPPLPC